MPTSAEQQEASSPDFAAVARNLFREKAGKFYIGNEEISKDIRSILRDEAEYLQRSKLWELLNNAIVNESAELALISSQSWEHVEVAKMLHHWGHVFRNIIAALAKK